MSSNNKTILGFSAHDFRRRVKKYTHESHIRALAIEPEFACKRNSRMRNLIIRLHSNCRYQSSCIESPLIPISLNTANTVARSVTDFHRLEIKVFRRRYDVRSPIAF